MNLGLGVACQMGKQVLSTSFLLDDTSPAAAFSLRKLSDTATNSIRVRRSSDNAEKTIGFSGNLTDTASIVEFASGSDCFVTTWFDQSGNSNDLVQTTAAAQPQIYDASNGLIMQKGRPAIYFAGVSNILELTSALTANSEFFCVLSSSDTAASWFGGPSIFIPLVNSPQTQTTLSIPGGITSFRKNGATISPVTRTDLYNAYHTDTSTLANLIGVDMSGVNSLGQGDNILSFWRYRGVFQEVIVYGSEQSSKRDSIETNINNFYNIY